MVKRIDDGGVDSSQCHQPCCATDYCPPAIAVPTLAAYAQRSLQRAAPGSAGRCAILGSYPYSTAFSCLAASQGTSVAALSAACYVAPFSHGMRQKMDG